VTISSLIVITLKVSALTLAGMLAAGGGSAAATTLTPMTSPTHSVPKHSVMPAATRSRSPAARPTASCHPTTSSGHCYQPGEYCRKSDHGKAGLAGDGAKIICKNRKGWRWERA
jgi:hypothetical protein